MMSTACQRWNTNQKCPKNFIEIELFVQFVFNHDRRYETFPRNITASSFTSSK